MEGDRQLPVYSFGGAIAMGWASLRGGYLQLLAMSIVALLIVAAVSGLAVGVHRVTGFAVLGPLANIFIFPQLAAGLGLAGATMARGGRPAFGAMFTGFRSVWRIAGVVFTVVLISIGIFLPSLVAAVLIVSFGGGGGAGLAVIVGLLIVSGVVQVCVVIRFACATLLVAEDRGTDVFAAMRRSWEITSGAWPSLIGLVITMVVLSTIAAVLLVAPFVFVTAPLTISVYGAAYAMLVAHADA